MIPVESLMSSLESEQPERKSISLGTSLLIVAAIAGACGVVVQIKRCYAAIGTYRAPAFIPTYRAVPFQEEYATLAVLLWMILGSLAFFAIRKTSVAQLAGVFLLSCAIILPVLTVRADMFDRIFPVLWPAAVFGLCFVTPHLLVRINRAGDRALLLADAAIVALLTYEFALKPFVPLM
jgi:hypothetical protein